MNKKFVLFVVKFLLRERLWGVPFPRIFGLPYTTRW
jgi:hypothetical protein